MAALIVVPASAESKPLDFVMADPLTRKPTTDVHFSGLDQAQLAEQRPRRPIGLARHASRLPDQNYGVDCKGTAATTCASMVQRRAPEPALGDTFERAALHLAPAPIQGVSVQVDGGREAGRELCDDG